MTPRRRDRSLASGSVTYRLAGGDRSHASTDLARPLASAAIVGLMVSALVGCFTRGASAQSTTAPAADARLSEAIDLYTGVAGRVDDARARAILLELARARGDDPLVRMWIARVHSRGRMGFERNDAEARRISGQVVAAVRDLAARGDTEAAFLMGTAYDEALGVEADAAEAMRWYRRAAAHGHVLAAHNVGNLFRDGRGTAADQAAAVRWWLRAARAGDAITQLRLGEAFEAGRGVPRDAELARSWYQKAAAAGNAAAAEALRRMPGFSAPRPPR